MLLLDKVEFQYPGNSTRFEFSLSAKRGEVIGIMGASGSGKSTLLEIIAGFLSPLSGSIRWDDDDIQSTPAGKRPVTVLFQNHNLFEHLSVKRNIAIGLTPGNETEGEQEEIILQSLANVGLEQMIERTASELSGGQQQRVALARASIRPQPIVLLDEPFTGLDEETKFDVRELVAELASKREKCVLMVTHDVTDCESLAHQLYNVEAGKLSKLR